MKSYRETIVAGQPLRLSIGGRVLYIQRSEGGPVLTVEFTRQGGESQKIERVGKGFKAAPRDQFQGVTISTTVTGQVDFVITDGDIDIKFDEDATIIGNDVSQPIPVIFDGTVAPVFGDVTNSDANAIPIKQKVGAVFTVHVDNLDAAAVPVQQKIGTVFNTKNEALTTIVDHAAAVINTGAAQLLISDATYRRLRIRNASLTQTVAIGGAAVTMASGAIILLPGDTWIEDDAAGVAWYATSDIAAADVRVMGLK